MCLCLKMGLICPPPLSFADPLELPPHHLLLSCSPSLPPKELLPFLSDSIDDDDLVLLKLSSSLPSLTPAHLGGAQFMHLLLQPLVRYENDYE